MWVKSSTMCHKCDTSERSIATDRNTMSDEGNPYESDPEWESSGRQAWELARVGLSAMELGHSLTEREIGAFRSRAIVRDEAFGAEFRAFVDPALSDREAG